VIYPVDSAIQLLNNWGLEFNGSISVVKASYLFIYILGKAIIALAFPRQKKQGS